MKNDLLFARINKIVQVNLRNPKFNTQDIANKVFYTREYVGRAIKAHTGMTYFEYVGKLRVEEAKKLLRLYSVWQTAKLMGYRTHDGFGAMFKRYSGTTPIEFKRSVQ